MADEVDLGMVAGRPDILEDAGVRTAVAGMTILFRMVLAVVDRAADEAVIEFAGPVPKVVDGADGRTVALKAVLAQVPDRVLAGAESPAGQEAADAVFVAVAHEAVDQNDRVLIVAFHRKHSFSFRDGYRFYYTHIKVKKKRRKHRTTVLQYELAKREEELP